MACASARRLPVERWELVAGRVVAVRPGGRAATRAKFSARPAAARRRPAGRAGTAAAARRRRRTAARWPRGGRVPAAGQPSSRDHELAEQLDVVVAALEHPLVDRLLGRPDRGGDAPAIAPLTLRRNSIAGSVTRSAQRVYADMGASDTRDGRLSTTSARAGAACNPFVYWPRGPSCSPRCSVYFRLSRARAASTSRTARLILAANHRSFLDPFIIGCCLRRPIYFVAKQELFDKRLQGWFLNCLGAFPVRRGESDEESVRPRGAARARRGRRDLPRGHAHPHRLARHAPSAASAAWRSRAARRSCRSR